MNILIVDDDNMSRNSLGNFLRKYLNHQVTDFSSAFYALNALKNNEFSMVISDIRMPGITGIELLKEIKSSEKLRHIDVVLITGHGDLNSAIAALRLGAFDYLQKPINVEELAVIVDKVAEHQSLMKENYELKFDMNRKVQESTKEIQEKYSQLKNAYSEIVGVGQVGIFSNKMKRIFEMTQRLHQNREIPVLIQGETGTGKEIIAKLVHYGDCGETSPFISINCSAISPSLFESELFGYESGAFTGAQKKGMPGKLELSQGGTLFLDEIGELPLEQQPKLLRVLQEKEIYRIGGIKKIKLDVRIVCATNKDLSLLVEKGSFRKDLLFRLNTGLLDIPSLSERKEEIMPFAEMFMLKFANLKKKKFRFISSEAEKILVAYNWPGNVRELQNTIERVVLLYDDIEIKPEHLSFLEGFDNVDYKEIKNNPFKITIDLKKDKMTLEEIDCIIVNNILDIFQGNKSRAAEYLGISRNTLRKKIEELIKR